MGKTTINTNYHSIIIIEPDKRSGKACIRGLRITVDDILDCFAAGMTEQDVLNDYDYLTQDDIRACFAHAADRERHTRVISG
ncbi:DUF433 domain-containing protein [Crenothrix polyspora]|uniref:DUF433 domain-containing protein n=1 Tax=Crenothrix polyspora TaxID=360316 RepID=A0A1R4H4Y0_9GAMM|nr:conserved hypothetical protein [Crenothrix polyspora]